METQARIIIAGSNSFITTAISAALKRHEYSGVLNDHLGVIDFTDATVVNNLFKEEKPEYIFLVGGKSAGIMGNKRFPADLMMSNLLIECSVISNAHRHRIKKLLYLASSCCYPRLCSQPMNETDLLSGLIEPTSEYYAMSKIAGWKLIQAYRKQFGENFICGIPTNSFGPGDEFSPEDSHVVGALIRRIHEAKKNELPEVVIWGTGTPSREFEFVDDLAEACVFVMNTYNEFEPINLGCGEELSIAELAKTIQKVVGYTGKMIFDASKPDGMPHKLLDSTKLMRLGWKPSWTFHRAIEYTYAWYCQQNN